MATALTVQDEFDQAYEAEEAIDPRILQERVLEAARVIVARLDGMVRDCVRAKQPIEERWIKNIRSYLGVYEPTFLDKLVDADQSTAFVKLTRHKTNGWAARISDLLFPTDNKNWGVSPTPIPRLTGQAREAQEAAKKKVEEANAAADAGDPETQALIIAEAGSFRDQVAQHYAAIEEAKKRAEWMERTIEDQLIESDYITECRDVIEDGVKLGTGILKGPMTVQALQPKWSEVPVQIDGMALIGEDGQPKKSWQLQKDPDPRPMFTRVNPWFFYPDMSATAIKGAEFTFELSLPSRKDLKRAAKKLGFNREAVQRLLTEGPPHTPDSVLVHLAEVRSLTGENEDIKNRYVQWEFNGALEGDEIAALLRATGQIEQADRFELEKDPFEEYRVIIWFIGNEVLKIAPEYPLDSGDGLYSVWTFEKSEASIFGYGVPEIMSDSQNSLNNAWRMMQDNGALAVGPQILADRGAVEPQIAGDWKMKPLKLWLLGSTSYNTVQRPAFQTFDIPSNQAEYAGIITLAKAFADEESGLPDVAEGESGARVQPVGTTSILTNNANVILRRVVKSWDDDLTKPTLRRAFDWNMQFNPDDSIKGDMSVDARGTSVLMTRELQSQTLLLALSQFSVNPLTAPHIKVRDILVKFFQTMMIAQEDVLHTEDEVEKKMAEAAQQAPEMDPVIQAKLEIATMEAETRRSIAQMQMDVAVMKVAQETGKTEAEVKAKYGIEEMKIGSQERTMAAKIAVEERREESGLPVGLGVG